jgi:hypothetical protein
MFDKGAINELSQNLKDNRDELKRLVEEYGYLEKSHKSLINRIKSTISSVDSYYESNNELMHSFVLKSGNVKRAYEEMNALVEEHTAKIIQVDSSMDKLSKKYKAPKEEIAEIIGKLEEYDKLDKEIKKRQAKGDNGAYTKDLIDKQDKFIQNLQNQSNLFQEMFSDYQNNDSKIKKQIKLNGELAETVDEVGKAQGRVNKEIEEGSRRYEKFKKNGLSDIVSGLWGAVKNLAIASWDKYKEVDQAGRDFGRQMGMSTSDLEKHTTSLFNNYKDMASKLGMEFKEMYKFQTSYAEVTEKATMLSMDQVGAMASVTRNVGEEAVSVASKNLDVFTTSADATIDYLGKGTARAALEGLNVKKFSDAFANNIKMASKYTFKEGITGIQKMTLLSQRLKFNMESIGTAMDKFSTIEGAIEASAKIQVLGGAFAQNFANPLQAMSEALLDGEAFTKRIIDTVSSQARFNSKTGEIDLAPIDKQRLKAYADALGISYDEVHNMATQTRKGKEIERVVGEGKFTKEEIAYLSNKAQYDQETGKWKIIGVDGETEVGDISKMSQDKLNEIRKTDTHEKMLNSNVTEIKKLLQEQAKAQKSQKEFETGIKEGVLLGTAGWANDLPGWMKMIIGIISVTGAIAGASNLMSMGGGLVKGGRSLFSRGGGGAKANLKGTASGAKNGIKTTVTKNGQIQYRNASGQYVKKSVAEKALKSAKVGNVAGKALGIAGLAYTAYDVASSINDYDKSKKEIMASEDTTRMEKAMALNDAKKTRNSNIGGSLGGAAAAGAVGLALMGTGVGFIPGLLLSIGAGIAGSMAGSAIGEAVTEDVDETLKEIKEENGEEIKDNEEDIDTNNEELNNRIEAIKNATLNIERNTENLYVATLNRGGSSYVSHNVRGTNTSTTTTISVNDIKVNVGGQIKLVGEGGLNSVNIDELLNNNRFRKGIADIIKTHVNTAEVIGKTNQQ